jgi:SNF2 family DNA or RNA helicase
VFTLDDYQVVASDEMRSRRTFGLFDEAGVGKTHPAVVAALEFPAPRLVTLPAYLIPQFEGMIKQVDGNLTTATTLGDGPDAKHAALQANVDFVLSSYNTWGTFHNDAYRYPETFTRPWGAFIFDEAQRMRGYRSLWTKQVWKLRNADSRHRQTPIWELTGTPIVSGPADVYPFLHLCNRLEYPGFWSWAEEWCVITEDPWMKHVKGVRRGKEEAFRTMLREWSLRRRCEDIPQLRGLECRYKDIPITLPASVYKSMKTLVKEYRLEHPDLPEVYILEHSGEVNHRLRLMTTLPPTSAQPKLDGLVDYLEDRTGDRVVVFAWHREVVTAVLNRIRKRWPKRPIYRFDGDTSTNNKIAAQQAYQMCPDTVVVATIAAMNAGVNLQAGHHCVFIEESYLPGENEQAVKRLLRRGQTRPVIVTRFRAVNSVDEKVWKVSHERGETNRRALGEERV